MESESGEAGTESETGETGTEREANGTNSGRRKRGRGRQGGGRRRNDRGQFVETVDEAAILDLLERLPGPVITTTDVADRYDITTEGARRKLNDLCADGVLDRRKSGQTRVYWRVGGDR
jgi:ribosomal protein S25